MSRREKPSGEHLFDLSGGALCLDFANTVGDRPRRRKEHLHGYSDLLSWARQAMALEPEALDRLDGEAGARPGAAGRAFAGALELRERLYRIFSALAGSRPVAAGDLAALNRALRRATAHRELRIEGERASWAWVGRRRALDRVVWPVVLSAGELLVSDEAARIRECDADRCSWLFIDRSRGRRRRWCDMRTCGNRAKARRHYERVRKRASGSVSTAADPTPPGGASTTPGA